jgi:hypothetical protein
MNPEQKLIQVYVKKEDVYIKHSLYVIYFGIPLMILLKLDQLTVGLCNNWILDVLMNWIRLDCSDGSGFIIMLSALSSLFHIAFFYFILTCVFMATLVITTPKDEWIEITTVNIHERFKAHYLDSRFIPVILSSIVTFLTFEFLL